MADEDTWLTEGKWEIGANMVRPSHSLTSLVIFSLSMFQLGLVVFAIVTGIAIAIAGEHGKPLLDFFESLSIVMMKITTWIIHLTPLGVCFLVASQLLETKNVSEEFVKLGYFFLVVILGLGIHGLLVLPLIFTLVTRKLPFR